MGRVLMMGWRIPRKGGEAQSDRPYRYVRYLRTLFQLHEVEAQMRCFQLALCFVV